MRKLIFLIGLLLICPSVWATNYGSSLDGESASITFIHTADCDSARAWFGYDGDASGDDTSNFYYSIKLLPCFNDDKLLMADNVSLDSIGTHIVKLVYFVAGPDSGSVGGIWLNTGGATDTTKIKAVADNNPQIWTDQSSGAGSEQETLIVLDGDDNAVEGAKISIWNDSGTPYANNITDGNGKHIFYLDVGTYIIGTRRVGIHSSTDTLEIAADGTDTITVVAHTPPGAPGSDSVCVEGYIFDLGYTYPTTGLEVIFYLGYETAIQDTSTGVFLEKVPVSVAVDDTGYFKTYLPASNNLVAWRDYIAGDWSSADTIFYIVEIKGDTRVVLPPIEGVFIPDTTGCLDIKDIPFR